MKERKGFIAWLVGAYVLGGIGAGMGGYAVFLWPERTQIETEKIKAQTENTQALTRYVEAQRDAARRDTEKIAALNEATRALYDLANALETDAQVQELKRILNEYNRSLNAK